MTHHRPPFSDIAQTIIQDVSIFIRNRVNIMLQNQRRCIHPHVILEFGRLGIFGMDIPKDFGGLGLSQTDISGIIERIASYDMTLAALVGQNNTLGSRPLIYFADTDLQNRYLPQIAAGKMLAGCAITEPGAGSNPSAMNGTFTPDKQAYILNAQKKWIGMGSWASVFCVFAKNKSPDDSTSSGLTAAMIASNANGVHIGPEALTWGHRGSVQNQITFKNVHVPKHDIVGKPGRAFMIANDVMQATRLGMAASALGQMKHALWMGVSYSTRRTIRTGQLSNNPESRIKLSKLQARISLIETLVYRTSELLDQGVTIPEEVLMISKVASSEFLCDSLDDIMQLTGGRGYTENNRIPYFYQDARVLRIFEGPSETLWHYCGELTRSSRLKKFLATVISDASMFTYFDRLQACLDDHQESMTTAFGEHLDNYHHLIKGKMIQWVILASFLNSRFKQNTNSKEYMLADTFIKTEIDQLIGSVSHSNTFFSYLYADDEFQSIAGNSSDIFTFNSESPDIERHLDEAFL